MTPAINITLLEGEAWKFPDSPDVIAYANPEFEATPPQVIIKRGGCSDEHDGWIFLYNRSYLSSSYAASICPNSKLGWIQADFITTKIDSVGIQFWPDQGWAKVILDGTPLRKEINSEGKNKYLNIDNLPPGKHVIRVENSGKNNRHVTIYFFGFGHVNNRSSSIRSIPINEPKADSGNVIYSREIMDKIASSESIEYDHAIIKGDLRLDQSHLPTGKFERPNQNEPINLTIVSTPIKITNSRIEGNISFNQSLFNEIVDFSGTQFERDARFFDSRFMKHADFNNSRFNKRAEFHRDQFEDSVGFENAQFNGINAYFRSTNFLKEADFLDSNFSIKCDFTESKFYQGAYFKNAQFKKADFRKSNFKKYADFFNATFKGDALFTDAYFDIANFFGANFNNKADFYGWSFPSYAPFYAYADFRESNFYEDADFEKRLFLGDVTFEGANFNKNANFNMASFDDLANFSRVNFAENADFINSNFNNVADFRGSNFEGFARFLNSNFSGNIIFGQVQFERSHLYLPWNKVELGFDEGAYLALISNYNSLCWYNDANECYYDYRNAVRNNWLTASATNSIIRISNILNWFIDTVEWLLYGYGVKPLFPIVLSIIFILSFGLFFNQKNCLRRYNTEKIFKKPSNDSRNLVAELITLEEEITFLDPFLFSLLTFTSGFTSFLQPSVEYELDSYARIAIAERLLGPIFIALFITTIGKTYLIR